MYVHGGVGPSYHNEGFTFAYDMPTETAHCETCAAIALAFWAHRMFHLDPDSRYIDVMELAIYNSSLSGLSHSGDEFFYANPLAAYPGVNPKGRWDENMDNGHHRRTPWFHCPCCPPNISRLIAGIGEYAIRKRAIASTCRCITTTLCLWISVAERFGLCKRRSTPGTVR